MMLSLEQVLVLALGLVPQVLGSSTPLPIPGYKLEAATWDLQLFPDEPPVTLNGTVQEVIEEASKISPKWYSAFVARGHQQGSEGLQKREDWGHDLTICGPGGFGGQGARSNDIRSGIADLRGLSGNPRANAGPGTCNRVSCKASSAIWWCNDDRQGKKLQGYGVIGDGAEALVNRCNDPSQNTVVGQIFSSTNWNVIVRKDNC